MASFTDTDIKTVVKDGEVYISARDIICSIYLTIEHDAEVATQKIDSLRPDAAVYTAGAFHGMEHIHKLIQNSLVDEEFQILTSQT